MSDLAGQQTSPAVPLPLTIISFPHLWLILLMHSAHLLSRKDLPRYTPHQELAFSSNPVGSTIFLHKWHRVHKRSQMLTWKMNSTIQLHSPKHSSDKTLRSMPPTTPLLHCQSLCPPPLHLHPSLLHPQPCFFQPLVPTSSQPLLPMAKARQSPGTPWVGLSAMAVSRLSGVGFLPQVG